MIDKEDGIYGEDVFNGKYLLVFSYNKLDSMPLNKKQKFIDTYREILESKFCTRKHFDTLWEESDNECSYNETPAWFSRVILVLTFIPMALWTDNVLKRFRNNNSEFFI